MGLFLLWLWPFIETLEVQGLQDPSFMWFVMWLSGSPGWVDYQWHLVGRYNPIQPQLLWEISMVQVLKFAQADRYPWGPRMQLSIGHGQHHCCWQLGTWHWFCEYMDPHTVSFNTGIGMHTFNVLKGGTVTFCVVQTGSFTSSSQNFHTSMGSLSGEEWLTSSSTPVVLEFVQESCSDPDMTAPRWVCLHNVVIFSKAPP